MLSEMLPGKLLSVYTIIVLLGLLIKCFLPVTPFVGPGVFSEGFSFHDTLKHTHWKQLPFERVAIPLFMPGHCAAAVLEVNTSSIAVYDSLPDCGIMAHKETMFPLLQGIGASLVNYSKKTDEVHPYDIVVKIAPPENHTLQKDDYNCGIFAVHNIWRYLNTSPASTSIGLPNISIPHGTTGDSLREAFRRGLKLSYNDYQNGKEIIQKPLQMSSNNVYELWHTLPDVTLEGNDHLVRRMESGMERWKGWKDASGTNRKKDKEQQN
uniref:ULP_PROTEASE domain-containing protein n=1 Tax=Steinernema glaseri TaxID=37863 RepID=A0A1I7ZTX8_9BILA